MTQDQIIILCLKVTEIGGVAAIAAFVLCYSLWARWWASAIGRTIVVKDLLLILLFIPSILSIFFHFSRITSHVAAWFDICALGLIAPAMIWRIAVFWKIRQRGKLGDGGT